MDVPDIPLTNFEVPEQSDVSELGIKNDYVGAIDFGVLGCGQAGSRVAKSFYDAGYKKCLAVNTAIGDLSPLALPENQKLKIGDLDGSGKSLDRGKSAAEEDSQKIFDTVKRVFGQVEKVILTFGCGGGTGSGSAPVMIEILQKYLRLIGSRNPALDVVLVVALPTAGELNSPIVRNNTAQILEMLSHLCKEGKVGPIVLMDNAKIEKLYKGIPPAKFWATVNDTIAGLFHTFNLVAKQESSYATFDTEDYRRVLDVSGLAVLGVTRVAEGDTGLELAQALQNNMKKTLLCDRVPYDTAKQTACIVTADKKVMANTPMDVFNYGFDTISNLVPKADVHRGLLEAETKGVRAFTMVTGITPTAKFAAVDNFYKV